MSIALPKIEVKVAYYFPDVASYKIKMKSFNRTIGKIEYLTVDGKYRTGEPSKDQEKNIATFVLSGLENWVHPTIKGKNRCFGRLTYVPESHEMQIISFDERTVNMVKRKMHEFILGHQNSVIKDRTGNNTNPNLDSAIFEVMDESAKVRGENTRNELINKYTTIVTELYKTEPSVLIDFSYALSLPNIHNTEIEVLYNKVMMKVSASPEFVDQIYNNSQKALVALINRAIYQPIDGVKETAIETRGEYYLFNNTAIGKNKDEVLLYFNANPTALKALEHKLGLLIPREIVKLPEVQEKKEVTSKEKFEAPEKKIQRDMLLVNKIRQLTYSRLYDVHTKNVKGILNAEHLKSYTDWEQRLREEYPTEEGQRTINENLAKNIGQWELADALAGKFKTEETNLNDKEATNGE